MKYAAWIARSLASTRIKMERINQLNLNEKKWFRTHWSDRQQAKVVIGFL